MMNTTEISNLTHVFVQPLPDVSGIIFGYNIYLVVCLFLGVFGNLLVLAVYAKNGVKNNTDWFIVFIAIYDLISSCINVPVYLTFTVGWWKHFGNDIICKIHMVFSQSTVVSSAFLIGGLALERYVKVCRPTVRLTKTCSRNTCIILSVVTIIFSLPVILFYDNSSGLCRPVKGTIMETLHRIYYIIFVLVFVILFIELIISYSSIALAILRSKANVERHSLSKRDSPLPEMKCTGCIMVIFCGSRDKAKKESESKECTSDDLSRATQSTQRSTSVYIMPESSISCSDHNGVDLPNDIVLKKVHSIRDPAKEKQVEKAKRVQKSLRTTRLTFLVCLIFVLTWLPPWAWFAASNFVSVTTMNFSTYMALRLLCPMTFLINAFANPLLYISLNESFREKVKKLFTLK